MQTRDQKYADEIYRQIQALKYKRESEDAKKYGSMAHKLPVMIRKAGLMQTLAFVQARHEPQSDNDATPQYQLFLNLAKVLGFETGRALTARTRAAALGEYMLLTQQALDALLWYKRFAESVLGVKTGDEPKEGGAEVQPGVPT